MTIVEQYDFHRAQGASHDDILELIDTHRRALVAHLENGDMYINIDYETGYYQKLPHFIEEVLTREAESFGPFSITQD